MKLIINNSNLLQITAISFSLLSPTAHADWGVGLGIDNEPMRYEDKDGDINLSGLFKLRYQGDKFNIDKAISYELISGDKYAVEVIADSKNRGFDVEDNKIFKGMKERNSAVDLGGRAILKTDLLGSIVVDVTKDVGSSDGIEAGIKLGGISPHTAHWTGEKKFDIAAVGGIRYQSADAVDYYYGVKNTDATATRSAYKGKSATTPFVGFEAQANISKNITITGDLGIEKVASSIKNSSLTENKDYRADANVGFTYWF